MTAQILLSQTVLWDKFNLFQLRLSLNNTGMIGEEKMSEKEKNVMNEQGGEKVMEEKKVKQKRKMSKQTILTISMIMVSLFVISVATYA